MYYIPCTYQYPNYPYYPRYVNTSMYMHGSDPRTHFFASNPNFYWQPINEGNRVQLKDYGNQPFVVNIAEAAKQNSTYRTALWTGNHLQVVVMSLNIGEDIGLEIHPTVDQFVRIEEGQGVIQMGDTKENLYFQQSVSDDYAIMIPAGTWHNLTNTGHKPLKLYTIYGPPQHRFGTVHETKADAMGAE